MNQTKILIGKNGVMIPVGIFIGGRDCLLVKNTNKGVSVQLVSNRIYRLEWSDGSRYGGPSFFLSGELADGLYFNPASPRLARCVE